MLRQVYVFIMTGRSPRSTPFPYTTLFRSLAAAIARLDKRWPERARGYFEWATLGDLRSEEHTSELQSRPHLVCRLLLEKKKSHADSVSYSPTLPRHQGLLPRLEQASDHSH